MLYVTQTGCQWRYLPAEFGPWTRVWSQFRRWSRNGTWTAVLAELHRHARLEVGRVEALPSMIVVDSHLARGGSRGGVTFGHICGRSPQRRTDKGGPYGRTSGAKRVVAVDVTGLPLAGVVVPASTSENTCVELVLEQLRASGQDTRLELVLVDRGVSVRAAARLSRRFGVEVRRVGWDTPQLDDQGRKVFRPIAHAWRAGPPDRGAAHGTLGWSRRLAKSFENSTASASGWLQLAAVRAVLAGPR